MNFYYKASINVEEEVLNISKLLFIYLCRSLWKCTKVFGASLVALLVKNPPAIQDTLVWFLRQEDPLEKGMASHSSILAWRTPWTEEPGGLQSMGSQSWTWLMTEHAHSTNDLGAWCVFRGPPVPPRALLSQPHSSETWGFRWKFERMRKWHIRGREARFLWGVKTPPCRCFTWTLVL